MEIDITGIVILCGNYGSGKTETALNLAMKRKADGVDVKIADLDLVNPYFRTREAKTQLENSGINVVLPESRYMHADLPILSPAIAGMIKQPSELTILDAGGDDSGVRVLSALNGPLSLKPVQMLQVINPFRPSTANISGCIKMKEAIENTSKLNITGLVSNANLIDETTVEHIYKGYNLLKDVSKTTGIAIEFITAASHLIPLLDPKSFNCPVLAINRQLNLPWKPSLQQRSKKNGVSTHH